jgi:hypothetical protein
MVARLIEIPIPLPLAAQSDEHILHCSALIMGAFPISR